MNRGCSLHGKWELCTKFYSENMKGRDQLGNLGVGGRVTVKWMLIEIWCEDV
jgi:hypothetical protein